MGTVLEPEVMPPASSLALEVPKEIESLLTEPSHFEVEATSFEIDSEASYQVADQIKETLKKEAKSIDISRLEEFVRPLNKIAERWTSFFSPHIKARNEAVKIYEMKMIAYRMEQQRKAQEAQAKAEQLLQQQKQEALERAQKLEEKAAALKTDSAKQKALEQAESLKQQAAFMPDTVAVSVSEPKGVASDLRDNWKAEPKQGRMADALRWLADHPEWWDMIQFTAAGTKRFAKQYHNVPAQAEPFRFWNDQGFASKRR